MWEQSRIYIMQLLNKIKVWLCSEELERLEEILLENARLEEQVTELQDALVSVMYRQEDTAKQVEKPSPSDWLKDKDINQFGNGFMLKKDGIEFTKVTDTHSMEPLVDVGNTGVLLNKSQFDYSDLQEGDVIVYYFSSGLPRVMHRIIKIDRDTRGWFCRCQGDNNYNPDPKKIRWRDVRSVMVGVLY